MSLLTESLAIIGLYYLVTRLYKAGKWFFNYWKEKIAELKQKNEKIITTEKRD